MKIHQLLCGKCGRFMTGYKTEKYILYQCIVCGEQKVYDERQVEDAIRSRKNETNRTD